MHLESQIELGNQNVFREAVVKQNYFGFARRSVLHGYWRSDNTLRLRIILNLKQIAYEYVPVDRLKDEQTMEANKELNQDGSTSSVPRLYIDDLVITETMAVAEYLEDIYPNSGFNLIPKNDPKKAYEIRRLCTLINSDI